MTSYQVDVGDDPENAYSGAPQFDWRFFGNQTRIITKSPANYLKHRNTLGIDYNFYFLESKSFAYPPSATINSVIQDLPVIPVIQFANIGKINRTKEDGERAVAHDPVTIRAFQSHYPNLIIGGGQAGMQIAVTLREDILDNLRTRVWRAGHRLPTERALSEEFGLSRSTVRRVLTDLKGKRLITQTVGSGTYVADRVHEALTDLAPSMQSLAVSPAELMSARLVLEAHENLVNADAANAAKFQDVLAFLRNRVEGR